MIGSGYMARIVCAILYLLSVILGPTSFAGDDKSSIVRDPNTGAVVATITQTATGVTVRNPAGKVIESRERNGNHIIVRDSAGRVIRKEDKARK